MSKPKNPKIALIHDELIRRGGAELVFEELIRLFPSADVYALYAGNNPRVTVNSNSYHINTSYLQHLPLWFRRHPGRLLPLLPQAAEQLDLSSYNLVISSASAFAKGVITRSNIPHICYCHTPTRYVWDATHEAARHASVGTQWLLKVILHYLRMADFAAAQRPDIYIANSRYTKQRISTYYRRDSEVVYPPVDTAFFCPNPTLGEKNYFLAVARLTPTKYIDHAIQVCEKLHFQLKIVGVGHEHHHLHKFAGRFTTFIGRASREELRDLYRNARALLQPGVEDFGMASVEALSCGTPVIAYGAGGILEIIDRNAHGILYPEQHPEALAEAVRQFIDREDRFLPETLQKQAMRFSTHRFREEIRRIIEEVLDKSQKIVYHNS